MAVTVWEIVPEIDVWSRARFCYGSKSLGNVLVIPLGN